MTLSKRTGRSLHEGCHIPEDHFLSPRLLEAEADRAADRQLELSRSELDVDAAWSRIESESGGLFT